MRRRGGSASTAAAAAAMDSRRTWPPKPGYLKAVWRELLGAAENVCPLRPLPAPPPPQPLPSLDPTPSPENPANNIHRGAGSRLDSTPNPGPHNLSVLAAPSAKPPSGRRRFLFLTPSAWYVAPAPCSQGIHWPAVRRLDCYVCYKLFVRRARGKRRPGCAPGSRCCVCNFLNLSIAVGDCITTLKKNHLR